MIPPLQIKEQLPPFYSLPSYQYDGKQYYSADDIIHSFFKGKSQKTSKIIGVLHSDHKTISNIVQRELGFRRVKKSAIILSFTAVVETILKITKGNKDQDRLILHLFQSFNNVNALSNQHKEDEKSRQPNNVQPQQRSVTHIAMKQTSCEPPAHFYYMQPMSDVSANPFNGVASVTPISHHRTPQTTSRDCFLMHQELNEHQSNLNQAIGSAFPTFSADYASGLTNDQTSLYKKRKLGSVTNEWQ
ncbi:hypothetical protein C9374_012481 [Naegleria lovaniensis]|uniref:Uncharacterized protein n=1 Tax=Naegleria lovaniensis TaxID=51637 RepID=A0AA88KQY8_NAELO|nr:uncharacterized protein C9374_012481 [Naegleria lovaniensis]KAG2392229.1 hypothetical protein C9374_012481 [Naegleria lovaniensis]